MGRGLSTLQRDLLMVLQEYPKPGNYGPKFARPRDLIAALGLENTAATRAAVSKALRRLAERDLLTVYRAEVRLQGNGYRYGPAIG
ncbi:MarR family transcriptional regulator [Consotaella salsifontis]|uniref:Uncharacterized protein n=1 Tax=Consotaella salsifontis TaxID=1365950 RepID=A0A1T4SE16_9HYPH|nr:helix-turn-helix domain-containing protein [Consotaella salsifontis]SKA26415.1 hypothetical protein SAMN05428963_11076 [Consotaella salsifontis]